MMHQWFNRMKKQDGLTLIELIVVVAIIGVLAWLITPRVLEALGKSKTASMDNFANEVMASLERYAGDPAKGNGNYPAALDNLDAVRTTLNMNIGKTDGFLATGANWEYVAVAATTGTTPTPARFCAKLEGADGVADLWITNGGVFTTEPLAQAGTGEADITIIDCPTNAS